MVTMELCARVTGVLKMQLLCVDSLATLPSVSWEGRIILFACICDVSLLIIVNSSLIASNVHVLVQWNTLRE